MFTDYLLRGARRTPDAIAVMCADGTQPLSYAEFSELTHRIASALEQRESLGPGDKIAVFAPNSPLALAMVVGVLRSGAAWVALNPMSADDELARLLALVGCDFLIASDDFSERAETLVAAAPTVRGSVVFSNDGDLRSLEAWLGAAGVAAREREPQPEAPAMYMGTGGTTGAPKAVPITGRQLVQMCLAFNAQVHEPDPPVYLMATPMTHAAGGVAFPVMAEGGTIVVHDGVRPSEIFASIERHRVTRLFLPPTAIYALLDAPDVRERDFSSLRHLLYAAAPMSVDKLIEAMDVFGPVMAQSYGQSEAPLFCTYLSPAEHQDALGDTALRARLASCGRPSLVCRVEIMNDGRLVPPFERGEIVVRGDLVMDGYHDDPEASAGTRRPGGWHGTGDVGYIDDDGYVYIVDRIRDMIISGGFNVYPGEIEQILWSHDAVMDCAVIGVPDQKWGEAVTAIVELKPGAAVEAQDLIDLCKQRLGSIRAPKTVRFMALPRSPAGKVLKRELRAEFWTGQTRLV